MVTSTGLWAGGMQQFANIPRDTSGNHQFCSTFAEIQFAFSQIASAMFA
jgi:hypothetical protein